MARQTGNDMVKTNWQWHGKDKLTMTWQKQQKINDIINQIPHADTRRVTHLSEIWLISLIRCCYIEERVTEN